MRHRRNRLRGYMHFVWATYDRLPLITEDIEREVHRYIEQVCKDDRCEVFAVGGMPDHIHLFISLSNVMTFARLMKDVKGGSSRLITEKLKPGEWFKWQGSYSVDAVSASNKKRVIRYIENQKQHHADGTIWPSAEQTYEEYDPDATE